MTTTYADISTADIAKAKVVSALLAVPSATLVAVSSRDKERAQAFVAEHCLEGASDGCSSCVGMTHEEVLASPAIGAVYVPLPSKLRNDFILKALQSGKHMSTLKSHTVGQ